MDICEKNGKITVVLEERFDGSSVELFEKELMEAAFSDAVTDVNIDAVKLRYISSAGLKAILKIRNELKKNVEIINVSRDVYDTFEAVGLTSVMKIKRTIPEVSVDNCEIIGEGTTAVVYRLEQDKAIKVFKPGAVKSIIINEIETTKCAFLMGVPTAIPYGMVKVKDSYGIVFEELRGKNLFDVMNEDKKHAAEYIIKSAKVAKSLHEKSVETTKIPSYKEHILYAISYLEGSVATAEETEMLRQIIRAVPDRNNLLHGDFRTTNMMVQNGELMLVDMSGGYGHPFFDLAGMYLTLRFSSCYPELQECLEDIRWEFSAKESEDLWNLFIRTYLDTEDENVIALTERQLDAISCILILMAVMAIPDLFPNETLRFFKNRALDYYKSELKEICF